jgi:hypothetical protein
MSMKKAPQGGNAVPVTLRHLRTRGAKRGGNSLCRRPSSAERKIEQARADGLTVDRCSASLRRKMAPRCRPPYERSRTRVSPSWSTASPKGRIRLCRLFQANARTTCRRGGPYVSARCRPSGHLRFSFFRSGTQRRHCAPLSVLVAARSICRARRCGPREGTPAQAL